MNIILWILAGALTGFVAFVALNLNLGGGLILSIAIGILAAFFGGHLLAPMLGAPLGEAGEFNPFALLVAASTALGCLLIGNIASKRFGL